MKALVWTVAVAMTGFLLGGSIIHFSWYQVTQGSLLLLFVGDLFFPVTSVLWPATGNFIDPWWFYGVLAVGLVLMAFTYQEEM